VERCWFCGSTAVVESDGQYVCSNCGTVLGVVYYELYHHFERALRVQSRQETRSLRISDIVERWIDIYSARLARGPDEAVALRREAVSLFRSLPRVVWQGKSPRTVAAAVLYLVSGRTIGEIERVTGVSKSAISTAVRALAH